MSVNAPSKLKNSAVIRTEVEKVRVGERICGFERAI